MTGFDVAGGTTLDEQGQGNTLWDWFKLPDGSPVFLTLSVNPLEFPAAHTLALTRAFLRELSPEHADVGSLLRRVNTALSHQFVPGIDSPVDCCLLALGSDVTRWVSAGTVHGGVLRRDGTMEEFPSGGPPLGLMDGFQYLPINVTFHTSDVIVALSHGARGLFRGAADVVAELHGKPAGDVVARLQTAFQKAAAGQGSEHSVLFVRKK